MGDGDAPVRLDTWLDVACLFKTRSQAQAACKGGKVEVNGDRAKPHRKIKPGDEIRITMGGGWRRIVVVRELKPPRQRIRDTRKRPFRCGEIR